MLKKVRIQITTERREIKGSLFETPTGQFLPTGAPPKEAEPERLELMMEGRYHDDGTRVSISYKESEISGMEGATTTVFFQKNEPGLVTMTRTGTVRTALVFEAGCRHHCIYETPIMPFEVAVDTRSVENALEASGYLRLDYTVELRGANAERTRFEMRILPVFNKPLGQ